MGKILVHIYALDGFVDGCTVHHYFLISDLGQLPWCANEVDRFHSIQSISINFFPSLLDLQKGKEQGEYSDYSDLTTYPIYF